MMEITAEIRALIDKAAAGMELAGDVYKRQGRGRVYRPVRRSHSL